MPLPRSDRARRFQASPNCLQQLSGVQGDARTRQSFYVQKLGRDAKEGHRATPALPSPYPTAATIHGPIGK